MTGSSIWSERLRIRKIVANAVSLRTGKSIAAEPTSAALGVNFKVATRLHEVLGE